MAELKIKSVKPLKVEPDGIPEVLKGLDRWVIWKAGKQNETGKFSKIPCDPVTGHNINGLAPNNWLSYEQALSFYNTGNVSGIGIVLSAEHPVHYDGKQCCLVALDLDDVVNSATEVKRLKLELGQPYVEVSPSGRGLRMFALSTEPIKGGNDGSGHEMYSSDRFMTITGVGSKGKIRENTSGLKALENRWFPKRADNNAVALKPNILGGDLPETEKNIARVNDLLTHTSPDIEYQAYRDIVWSVLSTGWACAEDLARDWSKSVEKIDDRKHEFSESTFQNLVTSFDPSRDITLGTLYYHAKQNGWTNSQASTTKPIDLPGSTGPTQGRLLTAEEVKNLPNEPYRVRGLLPARGVAAIYGESGSGKSFLVMDLIFAIAAEHTDWFGMPVKPAPVVYVALEGRGGIAKRIKAWEMHHKKDAPEQLRIWLSDFSLLITEDSEKLATAVNDALGERGVVVIDTLNQSAPGADENSSADMGKILNNAKLLAERINGLVVLIHHTGKDKKRGLRGHSSLIAALDAAVEVNYSLVGRSWKVAKAKDDEGGISLNFELVRYVVGNDEDGMEVTSCAIQWTINAVHKPLKKLTGKHQVACMKKLRELQEKHPDGVDRKSVLEQVAAKLECPAGRSNAIAKETIERLIINGHLSDNEGVINLV